MQLWTATICCFVFPFNSLAKLAFFFLVEVADGGGLVLESRPAGQSPVLTNRSARHVLDAVWCVQLISRSWLHYADVILALRTARHGIIRTSSALNSRSV